MADREKVIKGLEYCCASEKNRCEANSCPYWESEICCIDEMLADALELLKEQGEEISRLKSELHGFGDLFHTLSKKTEEAIADQPEIVRCKDCKYYHKPEYGFTYCAL